MGAEAGWTAGGAGRAPATDSARDAPAGTLRPTRFTWREKKIIVCVVTGHMLFGSIGGVLVPFFPTEAQRRGVSQTLVGGVFASFAFSQFVFSPLVAKLVPVLGASRVFQVGLFTAGVSTVAFGLLDCIPDAGAFIAACYVLRVVEALGTACFVTAAYTIVANQFPADLNLLVGISETMVAVGIALGPALGGGLFAVGGYGLPFYALGGLILAVTFMTRVLLGSVEAWLNVVVLLVVAVDWMSLDPGLAPYVSAQLGITPAELGLYYLLASGTFAIAGPFWGKLCDRLPNNYVQMTACLTLAAVGLALIPRTLVALGLTMRELFLGGGYIPTFANILRAGTEAGLPDDMATQAYVTSVWCDDKDRDNAGFVIHDRVAPQNGREVSTFDDVSVNAWRPP
ncbi:MFS-type transporter SLC18B1-like [Pollicipes pollicipes]|uniref:MFS-type transporter SLC18B1-like n=1 Tax=Pollicipes pollicipes TaxID=41117 RepID=UPI00188500BB|nr:MFS-type transporter SLC18B1-like [Pollicipes pollicipes]